MITSFISHQYRSHKEASPVAQQVIAALHAQIEQAKQQGE
jgi:hypothetical protein